LDLCGAALPRAEAIPEGLVDKAQRGILLRRPFSFCDVSEHKEKTRVDILYCVVGPASLRMTTLSAGDSVSVIGPLGSGFWVPEGDRVLTFGNTSALYESGMMMMDYHTGGYWWHVAGEGIVGPPGGPGV